MKSIRTEYTGIRQVGEKFTADLSIKGKEKRLGTFSSIEEAVSARKKAIEKTGKRRTFRNLKVGDKIGMLELIEDLGTRQFSSTSKCKAFLCKCDCGEKKVLPGMAIGRTVKSCGCLSNTVKRAKDIPPKTRFEKLVVLHHINNSSTTALTYLCECDCGNKITVAGHSLRSGGLKSCGCVKRGNIKKLHEQNQEKIFLNRTHLGRITKNPIGKNNKTGVVGVHKHGEKFRAGIRFKGKQYHLGTFDNLEDAQIARKRGEEKYFQPMIEKYSKGMEKNEKV